MASTVKAKNTLTNSAKVAAQLAVSFDLQGNMVLALSKYETAIGYMLEAYALEEDPELYAKTQSYMQRVEVLKQQQKTTNSSHQTSSGHLRSPVSVPRDNPLSKTQRLSSAGVLPPTPPAGPAHHPVQPAAEYSSVAVQDPLPSSVGQYKIQQPWASLQHVYRQGRWVKEGWMEKLSKKSVLGSFSVSSCKRRYFRLVVLPKNPECAGTKITLRTVEDGSVPVADARLLYFKGLGGMPKGHRNICGMKALRSKKYGSRALDLVDYFGNQKPMHVRAASIRDQEGWLAALRIVIAAVARIPKVSGISAPIAFSAVTPPSAPATASAITVASASSGSACPLTALQHKHHQQELFTTADVLGIKLSAPLCPALSIKDRTFRQSNFKLLYCQAQKPARADELLIACRGLVESYARVNSVSKEHSQEFCKLLETQLLQYQMSKWNIGNACEYLWTCTKNMQGKEFAFILNNAIRLDQPLDMVRAIKVVKGINIRRVMLRANFAVKRIKFPKHGVCFRGTGFRNEHQPFFEKGRKYRVPGFLATSLSEHIAKQFARRADANHPRVLWRITVDPRGKSDPTYRCNHVNVVRHTCLKGESEYLFAPYSAFTVTWVRWSQDVITPHTIEVEAALDNKRESEDLPLAPWF